ncbi:hypothetical protein C2S51_015492 [Perilla frutescens var. frutescens]|nr:hypothetical protein C2S51_015492 [Perilla frutescens var. frutescens]
MISESRVFSGNPSIDLDTEEVEEEAEVISTRNMALKSAFFTIHFRKVARKNESGCLICIATIVRSNTNFALKEAMGRTGHTSPIIIKSNLGVLKLNRNSTSKR